MMFYQKDDEFDAKIDHNNVGVIEENLLSYLKWARKIAKRLSLSI